MSTSIIRQQSITGFALAAAGAIAVIGIDSFAVNGDDRRGVVTVPQPPVGTPITGLDTTQTDLFFEGKALYSLPIPVEDGLGPVFNKSNCRSCHSNPDGGPGNIAVTHFGFLDKKSEDGFVVLPGGTLLQLVAITDPGGGSVSCAEVLPPEANFTTNRITPGMMGYGLVEAIPDADILANADPTDSDGDGISGRVHWVEDLAAPAGSPVRAGRFGWKSIIATIEHFSGDASLMEMGLTNQVVGEETPPNGDLAALAACDEYEDPEDHPDRAGFTFVDRVTHFQRYMGAPPQSPRGGMHGETVFNNLGCNVCHTPSFTTSNDPTLESALRNREVRPYSDFLLHDMGLLGDGLPQGDAGPNEFRTSPLMGVARRLAMIHDGRVSSGSIDDRLHQAISLHGPFGEAAASAEAYVLLEKDDQAALFQFLKSLGRADFDQNDDDTIDLLDWASFLACSETDDVITPDLTCGISDINQDGLVDDSDLASFLLAYEGENGDCDGDGETDLEEIFNGAPDVDGDGIPDDCPRPCVGDVNGDGFVNGADLGLMIAVWGSCGDCPEDLNGDGAVNGADLGLMIAGWGVCP
ncbi:MAG: hypothetical protein GY895_00275 [Phycisphaera sp.]|nr:hypothetical protein [Phycisphaera sp.]